MISPTNILAESAWKEINYVSIKFRMANISLCSDYEKFCNVNLNGKKAIILQNIFDSLKEVKKKF